MADDLRKKTEPAAVGVRPATVPANGNASSMTTVPELPPSPALQWLLFGALIISCFPYVVNVWMTLTRSDMQKHVTSRLERQVQNQSQYLSHFQAGDEAFAKKHYPQAAAEYRIALQGQNNPDAHERLGQALLKEGNPEEAFAEFKEALRLNSHLTNAYSAWALALDAEGRADEASKVLQDGLARHPEAGVLHYNLAATLVQMQTDAEGRRRLAVAAGKTQEAGAAADEVKSLASQAWPHFTKASRNGVNSATFWCDYGRLLNSMGKYSDAEPCLVRAASENPNLAAAQFQLALAEVQLGKYAGAVDHFRQVLVITPDDPATLNELALLYATANNSELRSPKMGAQLATRACDATTNQNARYMDTLARCYAADGDFFQAIAWEDKAIHRATQLNDTDLAQELQARYSQFVDHKND
jgi:tetratricopeptide (TPR) repeat protein